MPLRSTSPPQTISLHFNVRDVAPSGPAAATRLLPDTPVVMTAAAALLAGRMAPCARRPRLAFIRGDCGPGLLHVRLPVASAAAAAADAALFLKSATAKRAQQREGWERPRGGQIYGFAS